MLMALVLMSTISFDIFAADSSSEETDNSNTNSTETVAVPEVAAGGAIVMSASTSQVVYSAHGDRKLQPGGLTKIMTAMIVIDSMHSTKEYNNKIEISADMASRDPNLPEAGTKVSIDEFIYYMLAKNSDVANEILVEYAASSSDVFVSMMNSKAANIGLMNTQFANTNGAYNANQYSTAVDMAVIVQTALRYEHIRDDLLETEKDVDYKYMTGSVKSNMTEPVESSQYLGLSSKDDMQLITVLLEEPEENRQADAAAITKYGFKTVTTNVLVSAGKKEGTARVRNGNITHVKAYTATKGFAYVPSEGSDSLIKTKVVMDENLVAPLKKGAKVGEYQIYVADELIGTVDLITKNEVKKGWFLSSIYISNLTTVVIATIIGLVVMVFLRILYVQKRRKKLRERKRKQKIRELAIKQKELEEDRRRRGWDL